MLPWACLRRKKIPAIFPWFTSLPGKCAKQLTPDFGTHPYHHIICLVSLILYIYVYVYAIRPSMCIILANKQNPLPALPALPCFSELGIMQRKLSQHWSSDPLPPLFINSNWLSVERLCFVVCDCCLWKLDSHLNCTTSTCCNPPSPESAETMSDNVRRQLA